jgi:hypothetical protein
VIVPPLLLLTLWPLLVLASLVVAALAGGALGAYQSFVR